MSIAVVAVPSSAAEDRSPSTSQPRSAFVPAVAAGPPDGVSLEAVAGPAYSTRHSADTRRTTVTPMIQQPPGAPSSDQTTEPRNAKRRAALRVAISQKLAAFHAN